MDAATEVQEYEISVDDANTEYSQELSGNVKAIEIQCRDATNILSAFTAGAVDTASPPGPYFTVKSGTVYRITGLNMNKPTLYVAAGSGSKVVEVRVWKKTP